MDNWLIIILAGVGALTFAATALIIYYWAKRGTSALKVWAAWATLSISAVCTIAICAKANLNSGPAEAISIFAGILGVGLCVFLPIIRKRIAQSELNKVISKDL